MRLLLDTHLLLWASVADDVVARRSLSTEANALIVDEWNEVYFSAVSVWEVAIKHGAGRPEFRVDPHVFRRTLLDQGYGELAITSEHGARVADLPSHHKDPFDRLLVAQAMVEGITLLTMDATLARYPGPVRKV